MEQVDPRQAAEQVFRQLTSNEEKLAYVRQIAGLYSGPGYKPSDAANSVLVYGTILRRWFDPADLNSYESLHDGLRRVFNLQLKQNCPAPEQTFIEELGRHILGVVHQEEPQLHQIELE